VHDFYDARREACAGAKPNEAHRTISAWQKRWPDRTFLLTQNVDRLLESAGCTDVIHLHGDARMMWCIACEHRWELEAERYDRKGCPACGTLRAVKPGIVFFGESAPRYNDLYEIVAGLRAEDTVVVIGTSGTVLPADRLFAHSKAYSLLVNLEPADQMDEKAFSERHYGPATQELPGLLEKLKARMD
jgi:NAD-dependent deacetylase